MLAQTKRTKRKKMRKVATAARTTINLRKQKATAEKYNNSAVDMKQQ